MAPDLSAMSSTTTIAPTQHHEHADVGPPIKPLDLSGMDADEVFVALEGMVTDMNSWLGCVEDGLDELLMGSIESGNGSGEGMVV